MFTGIVGRVGLILEASPRAISVQAHKDSNDPWQIGESVAVNGCCLTVVSAGESQLLFEMSEETLRRTVLGDLKPGNKVNLERSMKANGRFGGHIVQGHVDAVGRFLEVRATDQAHLMRFAFPAEYGKYLIEKGSIAVNGISLTAVGVTESEFEVWIIPHTWEHTNLKDLVPDDPVNLEFDMVAKYVQKLTQ